MATRYIGDNNAQMYSNLLPAGTVLPFAGSSAPTGWLLCQGQEISQTDYAALYAVLSTTYNTQTNPTSGSAWASPSAGNFRVPDYRGTFLRGVATFSDGVGTNVTLGGYQADAMQGHKHTATTAYSYVSSDKPGSGFGASGSYAASDSGVTVTTPITDGSNGTPRTATETRVRNRGVNYIIKY